MKKLRDYLLRIQKMKKKKSNKKKLNKLFLYILGSPKEIESINWKPDSIKSAKLVTIGLADIDILNADRSEHARRLGLLIISRMVDLFFPEKRREYEDKAKEKVLEDWQKISGAFIAKKELPDDEEEFNSFQI